MASLHNYSPGVGWHNTTQANAKMQRHLKTLQYDDFELTDAVCPQPDTAFTPVAGYCFVTAELGPGVVAAASRDDLFNILQELIGLLPDTVYAILESSHHRAYGHADFVRADVDRSVVQSTLWDFTDLLLNDGAAGLAVCSLEPEGHEMEVQLEEHKLLLCYATRNDDLTAFAECLENCGLTQRQNLQFISEVPHIHSTSEDFHERFKEFRDALGAHDTI